MLYENSWTDLRADLDMALRYMDSAVVNAAPVPLGDQVMIQYLRNDLERALERQRAREVELERERDAMYARRMNRQPVIEEDAEEPPAYRPSELEAYLEMAVRNAAGAVSTGRTDGRAPRDDLLLMEQALRELTKARALECVQSGGDDAGYVGLLRDEQGHD